MIQRQMEGGKLLSDHVVLHLLTLSFQVKKKKVSFELKVPFRCFFSEILIYSFVGFFKKYFFSAGTVDLNSACFRLEQHNMSGLQFTEYVFLTRSD